MRDRLLSLLAFLSRPVVAIGGSVVIAGALVAGALYFSVLTPTGTTAVATLAPITQEVLVTGQVSAAHSTDLAFPAPGQVAAVYVTVGQHVYAGQTLAVLNHAGQSASLEGAQAALAAAQARLQLLQAGTRPEQLAISQQAVVNAQTSAYVVADAAVHGTADTLFSNPRLSNPTFIVSVPDITLVTKIQDERAALEPVLSVWGGGSVSSSVASQDLTQVSAFLDDIARALEKAQPSSAMTPTALTANQAAITAARTNIATSLSTLTSAAAALTLAQGGATSQDIAAAQALVAAAQASVDAAHVQVANTIIVAPMSGIVTRQDANLGASVSPNLPLISLIGDGKFEVSAQVSEANIADIKVGDAVVVTIPGYEGVPFPAVISQVSPAPVVTAGVASYLVKATFAQNDPRIVAGLTVSLGISTGKKDSTLVIPSSAIITDQDSKFVYVVTAKGQQKVVVTTGLVSTDGKTEITSGLTAGDKVLVFGSSNSN